MTSTLSRLLLAVCALPWTLLATPAVAEWQADGNPVCTAPETQANQVCLRASNGNLIVVWGDGRGNLPHIYAQMLDPNGVPQWSTDGVLVSSVQAEQLSPLAVSDGVGGAIIAYVEQGATTGLDIYAQHISSAGLLLWGTNGVPVCNLAGDQVGLAMISDGRDGVFQLPGAIIAWSDYRLPTPKVYAQALASDGTALWQANGIRICGAGGPQEEPALVTDGVGNLHGPRGCILAWSDQRGSDYDIYGQRLDPAGTPLWGQDGAPICTAPTDQASPVAVFQSAGTAIVTWLDRRGGDLDIYAQRIGMQSAWFADGLPVCRAPGSQLDLAAVSDGAGGAIFAWDGPRNGALSVFGERFDASGASLWGMDGIPICDLPAAEANPALVRESDQGAIFAWTDSRSAAGTDVYAQRVSAAGASQWTPSGVPLCTAAGEQGFVASCPDGSDGLYATWADWRAGGPADLYAQHVPSGGNPASVGSGHLAGGPSLAAFPNPMTDRTSLRLVLPAPERVRVDIIDAEGRLVRIIAPGWDLPGGLNELSWNGRDEEGRGVGAGIYFARAAAAHGTAVERLVRVR